MPLPLTPFITPGSHPCKFHTPTKTEDQRTPPVNTHTSPIMLLLFQAEPFSILNREWNCTLVCTSDYFTVPGKQSEPSNTKSDRIYQKKKSDSISHILKSLAPKNIHKSALSRLPSMDPGRRNRIAAAISSLLSQTLFLLLLHHHSSLPSPPLASPLLLLLHLLSVSSSPLLLLPLKRKRRFPLRSPPPSPDPFTLSFNMTSSTFEWLFGLLDPLLDSPSLPNRTRLAISISRLSTGEPYTSLSTRFGVSERTARLCVKRLCRVLLTNYRFWLSFPSSPTDISSICSSFQSLTNGAVPNCRGAMTCVRFKVGRGTIAAQIVAGYSFKILNLAAGYRGDRTDFEILKLSSLYNDLEEGRFLGNEGYIVGDGNYPLITWLMVPFEEGEGGESFNKVHKLMCQRVRRVVTSLKKWHVLEKLEEEKDSEMIPACVGTCAMLHNALLMREDFSSLSEEWETGGEFGDGYGIDEELEGFMVEAKAVEKRNELALRVRGSCGSG